MELGVFGRVSPELAFEVVATVRREEPDLFDDSLVADVHAALAGDPAARSESAYSRVRGLARKFVPGRASAT